MLAAAGDETDGAGRVLQVANEGASDAFFRHALGFFVLRADVDDRGAVVADVGFPRRLGVLVGIDVIDVDLGRKILVLVEQIFAVFEAGALVEVGDRRVLLQSLDDLRRLLREAIALV